MSIWVVGSAFLREAWRSRIFAIAVLIAFLGVGVSFLIGPLSLGTGEKITRDLGLASLVISGAIMIFTGGVHLMGREIERKSITFALTRPLSRSAYVLGKFTGMVMVAWSVLLLSATVFAGALVLRSSNLEPALAQAGLLSALELVVLSAVVVLFVSIASPIPAMLYAFGVFVAGHTMSDILAMSADQATGASRMVLDLLRWLMPDLSRFDIRLQAVHGIGVPASDVAWAIAYAALYSAALLALACAAFQRKELA